MRTREYLRRYAYVYCYTVSIFLLLAAMFRHGVQAVSGQQELISTTRIVIDAGHGGIDGGTTSVSGVLEKELNLQIALRLEKLMRLLGCNPVMTRTNGENTATEGETIREQKRSDLRNRVALVNASENTILISIHQNHYPDSRYTGPQIFYADDPVSQSFAQQLQQEMNQALETTRTCRKADGVYLMNNIKCPGVLIECGFLSNYAEDALLQTPEHQKRLCCLIAAALMEYTKNPTV